MNAPKHLFPSPKIYMIMHLCPHQRKGMYSHVFDAFYLHSDYLNAIHCTNENSSCQKHLSNNLFYKETLEIYIENIKEKISRDIPRKGR